MIKDNNLIVRHQALQYHVQEISFLSQAEAEYALSCLWARLAGSADWEGSPIITFPAANPDDVAAMFDLEDGKLPWVHLKAILPPGIDLGLDTDRLPLLCSPLNPEEIGSGAFETAQGEKGPSSGPIVFPFDLVAATFLLLSRWEEWNRDLPKDRRGNVLETARFPARQWFMERPVLDEWALVVRAWIEALAPGWKAKPPTPRIIPTHDIDHLQIYNYWHRLLKYVTLALVRHRSVPYALRVFKDSLRSFVSPTTDPAYRLIRELAYHDESIESPGVFFFMAADRGAHDNGYRIDEAESLSIMAELIARGHLVGWHPGYTAAEDRAIFMTEAERFTRARAVACRLSHASDKTETEASVTTSFRTPANPGDLCPTTRPQLCHEAVEMSAVDDEAPHSVRMHFLRWRRHTVDWLEDLGVREDHTWGLNELLGFSAGTCHPFPIWSPIRRRQTNVIEVPLIVQDGPLVRSTSGNAKTMTPIAEDFRSRCCAVGGFYTFLIHNNLAYSCSKYLSIQCSTKSLFFSAVACQNRCVGVT